MVISEGTRLEVFLKAATRCECEMKICGHRGRCNKLLKRGHWEVHNRVAGGLDSPGNLLAMCEDCHENTRTYGKPH
jgi:hypothetical protein